MVDPFSITVVQCLRAGRDGALQAMWNGCGKARTAVRAIAAITDWRLWLRAVSTKGGRRIPCSGPL
ncbi:MAG TPA: hypothetical protein VN222_15585, partial [Novosphingobium sp.]|nr:hypothetical protein [Novosphingobium sp.]